VHDVSLKAGGVEARILAMDGQAIERRTEELSWSLEVALSF
jgi:hypothetical protein